MSETTKKKRFYMGEEGAQEKQIPCRGALKTDKYQTPLLCYLGCRGRLVFSLKRKGGICLSVREPFLFAWPCRNNET
jgi:hypothetical protein